MVSPQDKTPEKIRIKDSYRERIFDESQQLGKSYLETLYFIIDCYFAFKHGVFPMQSEIKLKPQPQSQQKRTLAHETQTPSTNVPIKEDNGEGITLDWDL